MSDAQYFKSSKGKGEMAELRNELNSPKESVKKEAVKKVIAAMTVGKDVSMLFTDVLNCMQTKELELKKLVYLYVMNYAKSQPDRAILAVNTFQNDAKDPNPLIRALAVRTMGCIRVDKITEYLCEPLRRCLKDEDPYVRKTAAVCVAKLYDTNPDVVKEQGFIDMLRDLVSDSNPTVVANAMVALHEIQETCEEEIFKINTNNLNKLLVSLNECTEWGQVFILDALSSYAPRDPREAESIVERVAPRLNHANSAVVLSAVRVIMKYIDSIQAPETVHSLFKKLAPPLVTLLSKEPEIQYVALRNINLIVQKHPKILQYDIKVFFCKYNDPIYVKMEKLEVMIMLSSERNIEEVLREFKEYAQEVDVEFVRKAVRAIGRCAIKLERAAERCVHVLVELIQTKVNYVVQEAVIVIKDIFRKYPNRYESIIATLCENLDSLDEPEAKASMIWIIGEYADRIDNADDQLATFMETFQDEPAQVQLALLSAIVKLFLKRPKDTQDLVQNVLNLATQETDNPDLRDRGFVYWRLLSADPEAANAVVLGKKPLISDAGHQIDPTLLTLLTENISTLASVFHKPPEAFVTKLKNVKRQQRARAREDNGASVESPSSVSHQPAPVSESLLDLGELDAALPSVGAPAASGESLLGDDFFTAPAAVVAQKEVVLSAAQSNGLEIAALMVRRNGAPVIEMTISNKGSQPIGGFAIQFNKNSFKLAPSAQTFPQVVHPNTTSDCTLPLNTNGPHNPTNPASNVIQIAIKCNLGVFYFQLTTPLGALFQEDGALPRETYLQLWQDIPPENEHQIMISGLQGDNPAVVQPRLATHNVFMVAQRKAGNTDLLYFSLKVCDAVVLAELVLSPGSGQAKLSIKTQATPLVPLLAQTLEQLLKQ